MKKLFAILGIIIILIMSAVPAFAASLPPGGEPFTIDTGFKYYVQTSNGSHWVSNTPFIIHHVNGWFYSLRNGGPSIVVEQYMWTGSGWQFVQRINHPFEYIVDNAPFDEYNQTTTTIVRANHDIKILMVDNVMISPAPTNPIVFFSPKRMFLPAMAAVHLPERITPTLTVLLGVGILVLGLAVLVPRLVIWVIHSYRR